MYKLNPALKEFWRTRKPYKLLKGGRFSSKTQDAGGMAAFLARNYSVRFLCLRQFQNRITDSVYTVVKQKIEEAGWRDEFDIGVSTIRHKVTGSEFLFYGIARNIEEIKGTEGVDICWIEEGEGLTENQWSIIDPTIRKENSEIWILWNPDLRTDFVQVRLPVLLGDDCVIRHINYDENPFLSQTAKDKAERLKLVDPDEYNHIYLGIPRSDDDSAIIKHSWVEAALDAHVKLGFQPEGHRKGALDVADEGTDLNAFLSSHGVVIEDVEAWSGKGGDIFKTVERAFDICDRNNLMGFDYDADGLGSGVRGDARVINENRRKAKQLRKAVTQFRGSASVPYPDGELVEGRTNKDFFANAKAYGWWSLRIRFQKTYRAVKEGMKYRPEEMISISSDMPEKNRRKLMAELTQPIYVKSEATGKITIDKAPNDEPSPNYADTVMIRFAPSQEQAPDYGNLI